MPSKYFIFPAILLVTACGGEKSSTSAHPAPKAETASIVKTAASLTPMERGAKLYKRCRACHTLDEGGKHKVGPNLWGAYIKKPSEFMKGNRMSFVGIKKAEDRDAVLLYMKSKTTPQ
jgi:cytochrome c